ncbi:hypothetical protein D2E98_13390 [Mycobacteroides abscessus]|uniref:hypothetical protein n=1 Tax=Mycobacteroides abscessus TaxID=36809 RepID=UPI000E6910A6|nr:hypothetical protein [Mycobacteroides abscessus]RIT43361.1 hypothetical protein D2E98_13390 [Mycobacteroides abscessus]
MTLREYEVATGDPWGRTTTIQLSDEDAKARGLIPHTKADTEDDAGDGDKGDGGDAGDGEKQAKAPANKAAPKAPANKDSAEA